MFSKGEHDSPPDPKDIRTIIGEGTHFKGILSFNGSARIDGNVEGEIISKGTLVVGDKSVIQANIKVDSIIIGGKICGNIIAMCRLMLLSNAEICGNIKTPVLQIEGGAIFKGTCNMKPDTQTTKSISNTETNIIKKAELPVNNTRLKEAA